MLHQLCFDLVVIAFICSSAFWRSRGSLHNVHEAQVPTPIILRTLYHDGLGYFIVRPVPCLPFHGLQNKELTRKWVVGQIVAGV